MLHPNQRRGEAGASAPCRRILSWAPRSHAINLQKPELTGLALSMRGATGNPARFFLSTNDILWQNRPHRLVVLSACQTGLGKKLTSEGALGLTGSFLRAGARTVVSTLWKVDDEATAAVMHHFYRGYLKQGLGPAAALALAQRKVRNDPRWRHPYYWAGFVATGDWLP